LPTETYHPFKKFPEVCIINPIASIEDSYWENIKKCVETHPKTRFLLLTPAQDERKYAEEKLGKQINVEYLIILQGGIHKLSGLLEEVSKS